METAEYYLERLTRSGNAFAACGVIYTYFKTDVSEDILRNQALNIHQKQFKVVAMLFFCFSKHDIYSTHHG